MQNQTNGALLMKKKTQEDTNLTSKAYTNHVLKYKLANLCKMEQNICHIMLEITNNVHIYTN